MLHLQLLHVWLTPSIRQDADNQLRTAGYEVINSFVTNAANDNLPTVATLSNVVIERLQQTVPMQQQVVSVEDRITLEEMQTSLTSVLLVSNPCPIFLFFGIAYNRSHFLGNLGTDSNPGYCPTSGDRHQAASR